MSAKRGERVEGGSRSRAEWVTFGLALIVLAGVVAGLLVQIAQGGDPPLPVAVAGAAVSQPDGSFHIPVEVHNEGDRAAAAVQVSAELRAAGGTTTGDQVIDFLGAGESESLVFVFAQDPAAGELSVAVSGFAVP